MLIPTSTTPLSIGSTLSVDASNGNDSTARRGRADLPFATIAAAATAAQSGDTIQVGPGIFNLGSNQLILPDGVNLNGSGAQRVETVMTRNSTVTGTLIVSSYSGSLTKGAMIVPGAGSVLSNFAMEGIFSTSLSSYMIGFNINAGDKSSDNVTLFNLVLNAFSDNLYFRSTSGSHPSCTWRCIDCQFNSGYDTLATIGVGAGGWPLTFYFQNCEFNCINPSHGNANRCIEITSDGNTIYIDGGCMNTLTSNSGGFNSAAVQLDATSTGSTCYLNGVRINAVTVTSTGYALSASHGSAIYVGKGVSIGSAGIITGSAGGTGTICGLDTQTFAPAGTTIAANSNLGSTGSATLASGSDDGQGQITLTPGGSGITTGTLATVTYAKAKATNSFPTLTPANAAAAALGTTTQISLQTTPRGSGFDIVSGSAALTSGTAYVWNYRC